MHISYCRIIPKDLQSVCDSILESSLFSISSNDAYLSAFRQKYYKGDSTTKISMNNFYSSRQLERIFPYMVFLVLLFALKRIQVLESNIK